MFIFYENLFCKNHQGYLPYKFLFNNSCTLVYVLSKYKFELQLEHVILIFMVQVSKFNAMVGLPSTLGIFPRVADNNYSTAPYVNTVLFIFYSGFEVVKHCTSVSVRYNFGPDS